MTGRGLGLENALTQLRVRYEGTDACKASFHEAKELQDLLARINENPHKKKYIKLKEKFKKVWKEEYNNQLRGERRRWIIPLIKGSMMDTEVEERYRNILQAYGVYNYVRGVSTSFGLSINGLEEITKAINEVTDYCLQHFDKFDKAFEINEVVE